MQAQCSAPSRFHRSRGLLGWATCLLSIHCAGAGRPSSVPAEVVTPAEAGAIHGSLPAPLPPEANSGGAEAALNLQRLLSDRTYFVSERRASERGSRVLDIFESATLTRVRTITGFDDFKELGDRVLVRQNRETGGSERWSLHRLGGDEPPISAVVASAEQALTALGIFGTELFYIAQSSPDAPRPSLKILSRSVSDLAAMRSLDLSAWIPPGRQPIGSWFHESGYLLIFSSEGLLKKHPLFVIDLKNLRVRRLGVSVGAGSSWDIGAGKILAVMVIPGGALRLYDLEGSKPVKLIRFPGATPEPAEQDAGGACMSFDATGDRVVASGSLARAAWFDVRRGTMIMRAADSSWGDMFFGCLVGFTQSGRYVYEADLHGYLRVFDATTGAVTLEQEHAEAITTRRPAASGNIEWRTMAAVSPDRRYFVVTGGHAGPVVVDVESGQTVAPWPKPDACCPED